MSGYSHNCARSITCEHIIRNPNGNAFTCEGIYSITTREYTRHTAVSNTLALCALLCSFKICFNFRLLFGSSELCNEFAFGSEYHKGNAKDSVSACGKDGKFYIRILHAELHFCTL